MTTFRSKITVLAFAFLMALAAPAFAQDASAPATPKQEEVSVERLKLAKEYLAVVPIEDEIMQGVNQTAGGIEADQRVLFRSMAEKHIDFARVRTAAEIAAANTFTEKELKAMIAFFSTPEGKSIRAKLPEYQKQVQPTISEVLKAFIEKIQSADILPGQ